MAINSKNLRKPLQEVGVKELKDQASAIIQSVQETGRPVLITRNNRPVARLEPVRASSPVEHLRELGLVSRPALQTWDDFEMKGKSWDSREAVRAILEDRGEDG